MTDGSVRGLDDSDNEVLYSEIQALMASADWYSSCHDWYDNGCSPTIDGMLGGLTYVHGQETAWTQRYLRQLASRGVIRVGAGSEALDCGAGIGRVAHYALKQVVEFVDTIEGTAAYVKASESNFARDSIRNRFCQRLEKFDPALLGSVRYDFVWIQWLIGHLTDDDVVSLFQKLCLLLKPGGKVIMKENCVDSGFFFDRKDVNLLRNYSHIALLVERAGMRIVESEPPEGWPAHLYPIRAFVLEPTA